MEEIARAFDAEDGNSSTGVFATSGTLARQMGMGVSYGFSPSAYEEWTRYLEEKYKLERVRPLA